MVCYYFSTTHPSPFYCVADVTVSMFLLSTYTDGVPPECAAWFYKWLREAKDDFQVHKSLSGLHYAAFGLGNSLYGENYNKAVRDLVDGFKKLSATLLALVIRMWSRVSMEVYIPLLKCTMTYN